MLSNELLLKYLNFRLEKVKAIRKQKYELAANCRDSERILSKEIFSILNPGGEFINYNICDKIIDDYCLQTFNCSTYDYETLVKSIKRQEKLKDLGI